jgi:predicted secreted protein
MEMGLGGTGDGALGLAAMILRWLALAALLSLGACSSFSQITGLITGGAAGAATGSPAVGFLVGVTVDAAANAGTSYVTRVWHGAEQDAIARAAADVPEGGEVAWKIVHPLPIGNEHGRLRVVRAIASPLAECKEIAFSVDEGAGETLKQAWFVTSVCQQDKTWKWAAAEPAVERWGYLQ